MADVKINFAALSDDQKLALVTHLDQVVSALVASHQKLAGALSEHVAYVGEIDKIMRTFVDATNEAVAASDRHIETILAASEERRKSTTH